MLSRVAIVTIAAIVLFLSHFKQEITKYESKFHNYLPKVDGIIVLTGGKNRIQKGFELLSIRLSDKLLISGVAEGVRFKDIANKIKSIEEYEYIKSRTTLGYEAFDTVGNALEAAKWIKKNNIKEIILVTSHLHMPRSLVIFKSICPNLTIFPASGQNISIDFKTFLIEAYKYLLALISPTLSSY